MPSIINLPLLSWCEKCQKILDYRIIPQKVWKLWEYLSIVVKWTGRFWYILKTSGYSNRHQIRQAFGIGTTFLCSDSQAKWFHHFNAEEVSLFMKKKAEKEAAGEKMWVPLALLEWSFFFLLWLRNFILLQFGWGNCAAPSSSICMLGNLCCLWGGSRFLQ